ncbi:MAG: Hsp33 family molecular chaperone HslO, partial [Hungatella sp.]
MNDYIIRATAANGEIRAFAATTRELVETARAAHNTSPVATAALGRLLSAGAMMGVMMKGQDDLLTLKIQGDGPMEGLTVTADSMGHVKGYVMNPMVMLPPNTQGKLDVGGALGVGVLSVIQDIGLKEPYVGQTILVTGEIAEDLTYYYATSEQTPTSVALGVLMNPDNTVCQAGGFILQLMPDASEEIIQKLETQLAKISSITSLLD